MGKSKSAQSKKQLKHYEGLYGEVHPNRSPFYVYAERVEDRSAQFDWHIKPHLHAHLYQVFLFEHGQAAVEIATRHDKIDGPAVLIIPPGTIHGFRFQPSVSGSIVTLADTFVHQLLHDHTQMLMQFREVHAKDVRTTPQRLQELITLASAIAGESASRERESDAAIQALVKLLLVKLYRLLDHQTTLADTQPGLPARYFRDFQENIRRASPFSMGVSDHAQALHITPGHLNRISQAVTGKPASWLIQEHAVREAQKLLRYTALSVSEIAYQLHFSAPTYFSRLFKKHTGISPETFRKRGRVSDY